MQSEIDRPFALIALCQSVYAGWGNAMGCGSAVRCCWSNVPLLCRGYLKALKENCQKGIQGACQILDRHGLHDEM